MLKSKILAVAMCLVPVSALAEEVFWDAFPTYDYDQVLNALETKYGPADIYSEYISCERYMCEGRSAYWYKPNQNLYVEIHNSGLVTIHDSCPAHHLAERICNEIVGIPNESATAKKILNMSDL